MLLVLFLSCLPVSAAFAEIAGKVRVIDGDTFDVGEQRVRLFGIDAPEHNQTCVNAQGNAWPCGAWVSDTVSARYNGQRVACDVLDIDRYGRAVARCHLAKEDVGQRLVQDGLAFAYRRYSMDYDLDEKSAAIRAVGLHGHEIQSPAQFRRSNAPQGSAPATACAIKGNVSSKGSRIYHLPGQNDYAQTVISTAKGERWFCTEAEARAAGWRRAKR